MDVTRRNFLKMLGIAPAMLVLPKIGKETELPEVKSLPPDVSNNKPTVACETTEFVPSGDTRYLVTAGSWVYMANYTTGASCAGTFRLNGKRGVR